MRQARRRSVPIQVLPTELFRREFLQCIGRKPSSIRVVSPFIGRLPVFGDIVGFCRAVLRYEDCVLQIVTRPPESTNDVLDRVQAEQMVQLGVDLVIRTSGRLHSKIYHFEFREGDQTAFIGSANFSMGGFGNNEETMAMMRDAVDNKRVSAELERLCGRGAEPYSSWKVLYSAKQRRS